MSTSMTDYYFNNKISATAGMDDRGILRAKHFLWTQFSIDNLRNIGFLTTAWI